MDKTNQGRRIGVYDPVTKTFFEFNSQAEFDEMMALLSKCENSEKI